MRLMLVTLLVCLFTACNGDAKQGSAAQRGQSAGATSTGFNGNAAYNYAKAQVDFGPRVPGTPAAKQAGDWIIRQMRARADTVIVQSFTYTTADGKKLPLRNILARFRPELKERVLYVTHFQGFAWNPRFGPDPPSHGLSLAPDRPELWVLDAPNSVVHVFDVSELPGGKPRPRSPRCAARRGTSA